MLSIAHPDPTVSQRLTFASLGGQLDGLLAHVGTRFTFFTAHDDHALDVTDCPYILTTGHVSASMDATYQATLDARPVREEDGI